MKSNVNAKTIRELERFERQGVLDLSRCFFGDPVPGTVLLICADPKAQVDAAAYVCAVCDSVAEAQQDQADMMRSDWEDGKGWRKYAIVRVKHNSVKVRYVYYLDRDEQGNRLYNVWSPLRRDFVAVLVDHLGREWLTQDVYGYQPRTMGVGVRTRWVTVEQVAAGEAIVIPF